MANIRPFSCAIAHNALDNTALPVRRIGMSGAVCPGYEPN